MSEKEETVVVTDSNKNGNLIVLGIALAAFLCVAMIIGGAITVSSMINHGIITTNGLTTNVQPTAAPTAVQPPAAGNHADTAQGQANMVPDPNTIPFAQSTTCGQYDLAFDGTDYVYGYSYPGTTMAGDIEVKVDGKWVSIHDNGSGEYTILRNPTNKKFDIRGIWGAGCLDGTDQMTMVLGESRNPNHTDFVRVRDVEIQGDGTIVTKYFDKEGKEVAVPK